MITSTILGIFFNAVSYLVGFLPPVSAGSGFVSAITTASGYISGVYSFLPAVTTTLLAILAFDLLFEGGYLIFKVIYWVIRRLPTQS